MLKALILVDIQNDFSPTGALPVTDGDAIVPVVNQLMPRFEHVIATKDWHPAGHASFAATNHKTPGEVIDLNGVPQMMWPDHCVQNTQGAEFIPGLNVDSVTHIVCKGTDPNIDSYSGFFDNQRLQATELAAYLRAKEISEVYIVGLATDYCVKFTALDAVSLGFTTYVIKDACRGVNVQPMDVELAWKEMEEAGCQLLQSCDIA